MCKFFPIYNSYAIYELISYISHVILDAALFNIESTKLEVFLCEMKGEEWYLLLQCKYEISGARDAGNSSRPSIHLSLLRVRYMLALENHLKQGGASNATIYS
jgi:hypothetical protein